MNKKRRDVELAKIQMFMSIIASMLGALIGIWYIGLNIEKWIGVTWNNIVKVISVIILGVLLFHWVKKLGRRLKEFENNNYRKDEHLEVAELEEQDKEIPKSKITSERGDTIAPESLIEKWLDFLKGRLEFYETLSKRWIYFVILLIVGLITVPLSTRMSDVSILRSPPVLAFTIISLIVVIVVGFIHVRAYPPTTLGAPKKRQQILTLITKILKRASSDEAITLEWLKKEIECGWEEINEYSWGDWWRDIKAKRI